MMRFSSPYRRIVPLVAQSTFALILAAVLTGCSLSGDAAAKGAALGFDPMLKNESTALALMLSGGLALAEEDSARAVSDLEKASQQVENPETDLLAEVSLLQARSGKVAEALHSIERIPALQRDDNATRIYAGLLEATGRIFEARAVLDAQAKKGARNFETAFILAHLARKLTDTTEAHQIWSSFLAGSSDSPRRLRTFAQYFLAQNAEDRADYSQAAEIYEQLLSTPERGDLLVLDLLRVLLTSGRTVHARNIATEQASFIKDPAVQNLVRSFAMVDGPALASVKDLQLLRDAQEAAVNPRVRLAGILLGEGDSYGAKRELSLALAADPTDGTARYQLANLLAAQGRRKEAVDEAERVLPKSELYVRAQVFAAVVAQQLEDRPRAERALRKSIAREADNVQLYLLLIQLLRDADDYERALSLFSQLPASVKSDVSVLQLKAQLLYELGKGMEALEVCRALRAHDPHNAEVANFLAFLIADIPLLAALPEAELLVEEALTVAPNHPYFLDTQAWILKRQGRLPEALKIQGKAMREAGDDISMLSHYAELLWLSGEREKAALQCERVVSRSSVAKGRMERQLIEKAKLCEWK